MITISSFIDWDLLLQEANTLWGASNKTEPLLVKALITSCEKEKQKALIKALFECEEIDLLIKENNQSLLKRNGFKREFFLGFSANGDFGILYQKQEDVSRDEAFILTNTLETIKNTVIKSSPIHRYGLFCTTKLEKGDVLCFLDGQRVNWDRYEMLSCAISPFLGSYKNYHFCEWNALDKETLLVRGYRTSYSFINHSKTPNVEVLYDPIRIVTMREIKSDEELLLDYTKEPLRDAYLNGHGKTYL